ncbi:MAG: diversity-generating retroelement protein Avd [Burkholderiales bacterium]|nr:diversity-generating retroelement protein Avd [Burkholderiales bacterium]
MAEELVLLTRLSDLLVWLLPKSEKFPRTYRFTVTQRMMDAALDCQEAVFAAQSHRGETRKVNLRNADEALNRLRLYLRLAHRWQWLSDGQYEHAAEQVAEIGKLLGGWIKQSGG